MPILPLVVLVEYPTNIVHYSLRYDHEEPGHTSLEDQKMNTEKGNTKKLSQPRTWQQLVDSRNLWDVELSQKLNGKNKQEKRPSQKYLTWGISVSLRGITRRGDQ